MSSGLRVALQNDRNLPPLFLLLRIQVGTQIENPWQHGILNVGWRTGMLDLVAHTSSHDNRHCSRSDEIVEAVN